MPQRILPFSPGRASLLGCALSQDPLSKTADYGDLGGSLLMQLVQTGQL